MCIHTSLLVTPSVLPSLCQGTIVLESSESYIEIFPLPSKVCSIDTPVIFFSPSSFLACLISPSPVLWLLNAQQCHHILTVAGCTHKLQVGGIIFILRYYQQYRLNDPWDGLGKSQLQNLHCKSFH